MNSLKALWDFRGFIAQSVRRDFSSRYTGTQLGFLWAIFQPLTMIVIYTVVFANIMKPSLPGYSSVFAYSVYLCSGMLTWGLFSELLSRAVGVFNQNANYIKKVNFPKLTLPLIVALSALIHYSIVMTLFIAFLVIIGACPNFMTLTAALPTILVLIGFSIGLGIFCGTINVFYRDVEQVTGLILQFWFWLTPIVYVNKTLPVAVANILTWNPLWPIIHSMQVIFLEKSAPELSTLAYPAILAGLFLLLGLYSYKRLSTEIADEL